MTFLLLGRGRQFTWRAALAFAELLDLQDNPAQNTWTHGTGVRTFVLESTAFSCVNSLTSQKLLAGLNWCSKKELFTSSFSTTNLWTMWMSSLHQHTRARIM